MQKPVQRPIRIDIPYSMYMPRDPNEEHSTCFFCRNEDKIIIEKIFAASDFEGLKSVITISEVKKKYASFKDKKKLYKAHTHFACDVRVMTQLYNMLGSNKEFSGRNNFPVPIDFEHVSKLPGALTKAMNSTYMHVKGANINLRCGLTAMNPNDVCQNVLHGLEFAIAKLKNQWKNVQNIHVKTSDSPALPIYSKAGGDIIEYVKSVKPRANIGTGLEESPMEIKGKRKANEEPVGVDAMDAEKKNTKGKIATKKAKVEEETTSKKAKKATTPMPLKSKDPSPMAGRTRSKKALKK